jgi:DNA-binding phage protein
MRKIKAKRAPKTKTVPYDVAEQLRTPEEMAAYLDAWFEEARDSVEMIRIATAEGSYALQLALSATRHSRR